MQPHDLVNSSREIERERDREKREKREKRDNDIVFIVVCNYCEYLSIVIYGNAGINENTSFMSSAKWNELPQSAVCIFKSQTSAKDGAQVFR